MEFLVAPMVIFLIFVTPIWLFLHYRYKSKVVSGLSEEELTDIESMLETIDKLAHRVETLERILAEEDANWRRSHKN